MKIPITVIRTPHVLAALLILACVPLLAQEPHNQEQPKAVHLTWGVKIPMRDGVKLNATVYRPNDQKEALPVIFELTPYISDNYHGRAYYFAQHGYVFALVDVRGRGNSEGQFDPFQQEPQDGHDVVEWLAQQPWSNGKVAMWGGSYAGYDQWLTLREFPPHLATIVPAAAAHAGVDFPMFKGIWGAYDMQWLTFTSGVTPQQNLFEESSFWIEKFRELYLTHRSYKDLDKIVGDDSTVFQKWIAHPAFDAYWQKLDISPEQYKKITVPILTITGDYDGDQPGAMTYYRDHMKYGTEEAKAKHYLIIGPWDHAGTRTPRKEVGGLTFGDASMLDMNELHVSWYDWTMKNGKLPDFLKKRVAYYVTGAEQWKYADSLEAISNVKRILYLNSSNGEANDAFHSGSLTEAKPGTAKPDQYVYDPLDVRPAELEKEDIKNNITDERYALNLFGDGVVYHSQPFTEDTEVSGFAKLVVWMSMDVPDTDFSVNLYEITPDGKSIQLTGDQVRARYRDSNITEKPVKPGEINRYEFSGFTFFSRRIAKGSRLRLLLTSPNSIYVEKNYNTGGVVAEESGKDARTAHITLYHDGDHPSSLELPLVK
ncbi:MAG: CocE/NonD family hydrolase [Candidatus Sulfotelmatobacter sp.]